MPALSILGRVLLLLLVWFVPRVAWAQAPELRPVISQGREDEVLALFAPYELSDELAPGWSLHSVSIDGGTINVWLAGSEDSFAQLTLDHPDFGPEAATRVGGFAVVVERPEPSAAAAITVVLQTLERNDQGQFWGSTTTMAEARPNESLGLVGHAVEREAVGVWQWLRDGLVFLTFISVVLLGLVAHRLRFERREVAWGLMAIVVGAAVLRVWLSPEVALAPWAYTRVLAPAGRIFEGPALARLLSEPVWLSDVIVDSTLAYSLLAPLAVYVHARYLLDDSRMALVCAGLIAVLPLHLRFSHSDAAFIPSITVSSTAFALVHAATRERSAFLGWIAAGIVGVPLALMYQVRPLNIMYFPLMVATVWVDEGLAGPKAPIARARTMFTLAVVSAVTFGLGVPQLLEGYGSDVSAGLSPETVWEAFGVLVSPRMNILLNPVFTPPGFGLFALWGAIDLWRRGRRRLLAFVAGWLLLFLFAHAYVVPGSMYMQARYHLHLVVPHLLLTAAGIQAGMAWLDDAHARRPWLAGRRGHAVRWGILAYGLASPLIHLHAVRYTEFNDAHEWRFVHSLRETIPAECTVIEYTGDGDDARFRRVGTWTQNQVRRERWTVVSMHTPAAGEPEVPHEVRALLEDPPECLYWYEGLPCFGNKPLELDEAPSCRAIEGFVRLEQMAHAEFDSRPYDDNLANGLGDRDSIELNLFRVSAR